MIAVLLFYFLFVVVRFVVSLYFDEPYIMGDELVYKTMALSFFQTGKFSSAQFAHVGVSIDFPNVLYQLVISWSFFLKHNFYNAIKLTNALISNLAIFPVYYLGRMHMPHGRSLLAAIVVMLLPEMTYANNVMPENLFFPLFYVVVYCILLAEDRGSRTLSCAAGFCLGLLYLTKPHATAVFFAEIIWALLLMLMKLSRQQKIAAFLGRVVLLNASAMLVIISSKFVRTGLEWGIYSHILGRADGLDVFSLVHYGISLCSSIFFVLGVPIIFVLYSVSLHNEVQTDKLSRTALLAILLLVSMVGMTIVYTIKIAPEEHFHRLHERYYYYALGLILVAFMASLEKVSVGRHKMVLALCAVSGNVVLWILFFYRTIVLPYGLNFNHDYLLYSWAAVSPPWVVYCLSLFLVCLSFFMIFRKNHFNVIASAWIAFFVLANALLFIGLNRVQYTVVSEIRKHRIFLESVIPDENSRVMLIDSSHVKRTNIPFWLNYNYTGAVTKPAGTLIQKSQIPTGTDYLILLDQYPLDFEPVKMDRDSRVTILHMVREDMRRLLRGVYQDYWTKKEFAFDSPSKFQTMRVTLSDWQPSYPNKLTIYDGKKVMTYLLDGNDKILSLPYAQHYSFTLEKTWNPKHAGLNNDNRDLGVSIQKVEIIP